MNHNQNKIIHSLLNRLGLMDEKAEFVWEVTGGRVKSTKEMTDGEAAELIKHLQMLAGDQEHTGELHPALFTAGNKKRRRVMSICYQLPVEKGFTRWDDNQQRRTIDMHKLDEFLTGKYSIYKKPLNRHTPAELSKVIVQFQNMLKQYTT